MFAECLCLCCVHWNRMLIRHHYCLASCCPSYVSFLQWWLIKRKKISVCMRSWLLNFCCFHLVLSFFSHVTFKIICKDSQDFYPQMSTKSCIWVKMFRINSVFSHIWPDCLQSQLSAFYGNRKYQKKVITKLVVFLTLWAWPGRLHLKRKLLPMKLVQSCKQSWNS